MVGESIAMTLIKYRSVRNVPSSENHWSISCIGEDHFILFNFIIPWITKMEVFDYCRADRTCQHLFNSIIDTYPLSKLVFQFN